MTKLPHKKDSSDDFQTPAPAINPLLPHIRKEWHIWEPACGKFNLVHAFRGKGYKITGTDIKYDNFDFLLHTIKNYDCIITNPPYSLKTEFIKRCYELGKPFALLLPLTTFETGKRQYYFKKYGVQVIFFDKRINFETPDGKNNGSWFATAWFTHGFNLKRDIIFESYNYIEPSQKLLVD